MALLVGVGSCRAATGATPAFAGCKGVGSFVPVNRGSCELLESGASLAPPCLGSTESLVLLGLGRQSRGASPLALRMSAFSPHDRRSASQDPRNWFGKSLWQRFRRAPRASGKSAGRRQGRGFMGGGGLAAGGLTAASLSTDMDGNLPAKAAGKDRKKILILMSDTGGGHRASAQALEDAFARLFPGEFECSIVDVWSDHAAWPYTNFVPAYKFLAKHPILWRLFWIYGKFPLTRWFQEKITLLSCFGRFRKCIQNENPDVVVSVHPLCQDIPLRALKEMGGGQRQVPFVTVVTDLGGAHPTWFDPKVDVCFVPSEPVRQIALNCGMAPEQLRLHGLPLRSGFWEHESRSKEEMRQVLGLKKGVPTALVVGGGDGVGGIVKVTEAIEAELGRSGDVPESQLVIVCGKNEKARQQLESKAWSAGVEVDVRGFVSNMEDLMAASDCIVTKAGPGTIAEAMCRGLPTLLSCYLPGQEAGNVPFVKENGFGDYMKQPAKIGATLSEWMGSPQKLQAMSEEAVAAGRPSATYDIARDIAELVQQQPGSRLGEVGGPYFSGDDGSSPGPHLVPAPA